MQFTGSAINNGFVEKLSKSATIDREKSKNILGYPIQINGISLFKRIFTEANS
jgi:hypothetical protein